MCFYERARPRMQLFEMEMTLPSGTRLGITCRGFGVDNYAAGRLCGCLCTCGRGSEAAAAALKQILQRRLCVRLDVEDG